MSNDPSQTRKVVPYKPNKRVSTFRKLDVDFAGTAIEQALAMQQLQAKQLTPNDEIPENAAESELSNSLETVTQPCSDISSQDRKLIQKEQIEKDHDLDQTSNQNSDLRSKQNDQIHVLETSLQQTLVSENTVSYQRPVSNRDQSPIDTSIKQTPSPILLKYSEPDKNYIKVPNFIGDELISLLDPYEFKVYFRLFRLSHGFQQTQCFVGYKALSDACNLSIAQLKRVIPSLIKKGFIRVIQYFNNANKKGTIYEVYTGIHQIPVSNKDQYLSDTSIHQNPNKDHDHDDLLNKRSSSKGALALSDDDEILNSNHFLETKAAYELITTNSLKHSDLKAYKEIKHIPIDIIKEVFKVVNHRSNSKPNSLKYFVKETLQASNPNSLSRNQKKKALEKIVKSIYSSHIGSNLPISELAAKTKDICLKEGVIFNNDLFNEVLEKK